MRYREHQHAALKKQKGTRRSRFFGKYDERSCRPAVCPFAPCLAWLPCSMETMKGTHALQWAEEISKLPDATFTIAFYTYSRTKGTAGNKLRVCKGCKWRKQLPKEKFSIDGENLFLFTDDKGNPKCCYRILIRYIGFPNDGFKLHKLIWI